MHRSAALRRLGRTLLLAVVIGLAGCATGPYPDPRDPLEDFNRAAHSFNEMIDRAVLKPLAGGYQYITPEPVDRGVTNFFNNLADVRSALNNLLQFKIGRALSDVSRVMVNTTVGVAGLFDVASNMNIPRYDEDFGQTLGTWGVAAGPYIVLPIVGPSSGRDTVGWVVDWFTNPIYYLEDDTIRWSLYGLRFVDRRADLLNASRVLDEAALDPYAFVRDAYLQKRQNDVFDGNPPEEPQDF